MTTAELLIARLGLAPLPLEGGWFKVTWWSPAAGAIVAVFTDDPEGFSALHRLTVTEVWFAQGGDPFDALLLHPDGRSERVVLGLDVAAGQQVQAVVPPGVWMGGRPLGRCSLVSTVTVPGFTDDAFELGQRAALAEAYPARALEIGDLTRDF